MGKFLLAAWLATGTCDAVTTQHNLARGAPELNPALNWMPTSAIPPAVVLGNIGTSYLDWRIGKRHPKLARAIAIAAITSNAVVSGRNVYRALHPGH